MIWTAEKIALFRSRLGWSRKKFAERVGVSYLTVLRWELGQKSPSRLACASLARLSQSEGVSLGSLDGA